MWTPKALHFIVAPTVRGTASASAITDSQGNFPLAASPLSITASAPSNLAPGDRFQGHSAWAHGVLQVADFGASRHGVLDHALLGWDSRRLGDL